MEVSYFNVLISMLGGLALFLYGMSLLGSGLEKASGGRLEKTLEKMSSSLLKSIMLGAVVTGAIQSSSATTVIVVGLVNARVLSLKQAIGVIMGANIGTTITAHIIRLTDLSSASFLLTLLKPETWAPIVSIIGIILFMSSKKHSKKELGQILLGFGILFTGLFAMSDAVEPLKDLPQFAQLFQAFTNPVLGVLVGAGVTAIIQSSSASIGILQALTVTGQITYASAIPIILGQNIGTCVTPIMASIGASKNAKRSAAVHLSFNIIGTIVFLVAIYTWQALVGFDFWNNPMNTGDIANFHTIFNLTVTILMIPMAGLLEKLACTVVRDNPAEDDTVSVGANLDERLFVSPGLAVQHASSCIIDMGRLAQKNLKRVESLFDNYDLKQVEKIKERENVLDHLEDRVSNYLIKLSEREVTDVESRRISLLMQVQSEFERVGDYAINIMECAERLFEGDNKFSPAARGEIAVLSSAVYEAVEQAINAFDKNDMNLANSIEPLEEIIDSVEETLKERHINRLKNGKCSVDAAFPFVEALSNYERIADHCANVGMYLISEGAENRNIDRHEYRRMLHMGLTEYYADLYKQYKEKYYSPVMELESEN